MKRTLHFALLLAAISLPAAEPGELRRDFDRDGVEELLRSRPGLNEIFSREPPAQGWVKTGYTLPEGVMLVDDHGRDAGLRFVDLNGDGFDDVLFSNAERYAIHLWNKDVKPHLGWMRGWSQFVRSGVRTGAAGEPPVLAGAEVRTEDGFLVVTRAGTTAAERVSLQRLIAFDAPPPLSPEDGLRSLHLRAGFRAELVAAEPVVIDPVYFDWDAAGRLWVVEMRDYPLGLDGKGQPGGVVKVLRDHDGDGRYEAAWVFLDGLAFPSSLMPWRDGVLIAAAPDIFYAEDSDGDGRADVRRVLFTGFTPGNQQHRVNGFEWGLDGWVHVANGDSGGRVRSIATGRELNISGRDLRIRPDTGDLETTSKQTQFGRRRDDWGHWFGNNNPTWLWHVTLPEHYLRRNPALAVKSVHQMLANYEDATRVYPLSPAMIRPNQAWSLNHVTSGCSPAPYRDNLFGDEFADSVFIGEPVHNVVHREVLRREGSGFRSARAAGEERSEFLASTDNWFRPVALRTGPDGALYVADMYRLVLEHPEWISPEMLARVDVRSGSDRGRIYRIVPGHRSRRPIPDLAALTTARLAEAMNGPNGWQRDTAHRLLLERGDRSAVPALTNLLSLRAAPQVRLQALAALGTLGWLDEDALMRGMKDPHFAVRCEALRQSEAEPWRTEAVFQAVANLASDGDASVRLQAAFTLGAWPAEQGEPVLAALAARMDADETLRLAVMSSLRPESRFFQRMRQTTLPPAASADLVRLRPTSPDRARVIASYAEMASLQGDADRGRKHFQALCASCHRLRGEGHEVGPALDMTIGKPLPWLLTAILDPNQTIEARYRSYGLRTTDGEELTGLITTETANNLVIKLPGGIERPVLRDTIAALTAQESSLMPTGFESALTPRDMADLLRWLRGD